MNSMHAYVLLELQKHVEVLVVAHDRMGGNARQEHLVHCHSLLEGCEVLSARMLWSVWRNVGLTAGGYPWISCLSLLSSSGVIDGSPVHQMT